MYIYILYNPIFSSFRSFKMGIINTSARPACELYMHKCKASSNLVPRFYPGCAYVAKQVVDIVDTYTHTNMYNYNVHEHL